MACQRSAGQVVNGRRLRREKPVRPLAETLESASSGKSSSPGIRGIELEGFGPGGGNLLLCTPIPFGTLFVGRIGIPPHYPDCRTLNLKAHGWWQS